MKPTSPQIIDVDAHLAWQARAGLYLSLLMASRERAVALLFHADSTARVAAIDSFVYIWYIDDEVADIILRISITDQNSCVRYCAAALMMVMHLRCNERGSRGEWEKMLRTTANASAQIPEVVLDVNKYLQAMALESQESKRGRGPFQ